MSKAQISITDLMFSFVILVILIVALFVVWNVYQLRLTESIPRTEMELYTVQMANQLTRSSGIPTNWEKLDNSSILALGLADTDRIIDEEKLARFEELGYDKIREISHIGSYNFYFLLNKGNVSVTEIGQYPAGQSVSLRRNVIYQNEAATIQVSLWQ